MHMDKYYEYRKKIRTLYDQEPYSHNDLGSSILEVKDKNKCVVSISMNLSAYYIEIECEEGTPFEKVNRITDTILKRIGYFLINNIDSISDLETEERREIESMITHPAATYCDHIVIGNMIKINLSVLNHST